MVEIIFIFLFKEYLLHLEHIVSMIIAIFVLYLMIKIKEFILLLMVLNLLKNKLVNNYIIMYRRKVNDKIFARNIVYYCLMVMNGENRFI